MSHVDSLAGKVAVVTGGAQGLGEFFARARAARGASIIITDVREEQGEAVAADLRSAGHKADFLVHDVATEAGWHDVLGGCDKRHGKVDILVNNAGLIDFIPLEDLEIDFFDRMMSVNVRGVFLGCKLVLPLMRKAGKGAIVNVSSISGMIANAVGATAYSASKGAIRTMTKAVAMDYLPYDIRANAILPGSTDTPTTRPYLHSEDPQMRKLALGRTPMGRAAHPSEIAHAVAFLASDESSFMTGAEVVVDGGWTAC